MRSFRLLPSNRCLYRIFLKGSAFIQKHSSLCASMCILLSAFATPYLIPENPDSAVFRSGSFGLLLLLSAYVPVRHALKHHNSRQLLYGVIFGFIFSVCLALGCEMDIYKQLLPGTGSLIRRFAVPCMLTPSVGMLTSFLFSRVPQQSKTSFRIPAYATFLLIATCYFSIFLALYPGVISYDFEHEIAQYTSGEYLAAHPVFHTLFLGTIYRIGETIFGTMTAGAALYSIVQLLLLSAIYARTITYVQSRVNRILPVFLLTVYFSLLPFHGVLAVSTSKDPLFAGLCTLLCLTLWEIAENPDIFLKNFRKQACFTIICLCLIMLRHNGVFAYLPACISMLFLCRTKNKRAICLSVLTLVLCIGIPKGAEVFLNAQKTPSSELMSIPCQQLMRTANYAELDEHEFDQIERWFPGATHTYRPHCADPAKGGNFNLTRFKEYPVAFLKTYVKYALIYPRIYIEAFLANTQGLWYPGDTSHAHAFSNEENEYIYLNTVYPFAPDRYPINPECHFPALQKILYSTMHDSNHEKIPFLAQLYCPATYSFGLLLCTMLLLVKRQRKFTLCLFPLWGILISVFFSAGVLIRYAYPIMAAVPVLFTLAYFTSEKEK